MKVSQCNKIAALMRKRWVTPLDALKHCGSMSLGQRVFDLRRLGYKLDERWVTINGRIRVKAFRIP